MTKEVAEKIVRGITDKIECNTVDIDDWAEFWGFTKEEYEEFLEIAIKALEQTELNPSYNGVKTELEQQTSEDMRDATEEERKSTKDYIDLISKPTGLQFDDTYEELDFVQPHTKISMNLQPCEDCISREAVIRLVEQYPLIIGSRCSGLIADIKHLPSITPTSDAEDRYDLGYNCGYADAMSDTAESEE